MTHQCPVCRGSQRVRLPLFHEISITNTPEPLGMVESSRDYPCPECKGDSAPFVRIQSVGELRDVVTEAMPAINEAVRYSIARAIADDLLKRGAFTFETGPETYRGTPVRGTLAVVMPQAVASMQERIEERQMHVVGMVAEEAERQVNNWGKDFHWSSLTKEDARRLIRESLGLVAKRLAEWRTLG